MYDRYMDDFAIMHKDKEYLLETLEGIYKIADSKGIHINKKKTHIVKASSVYTFLQMKIREAEINSKLEYIAMMSNVDMEA